MYYLCGVVINKYTNIIMEMQPVRAEIRALPVGASTTISTSRIKEGALRTYASILSFEMEAKFSVHRDHETRSFIVTREH